MNCTWPPAGTRWSSWPQPFAVCGETFIHQRFIGGRSSRLIQGERAADKQRPLAPSQRGQRVQNLRETHGENLKACLKINFSPPPRSRSRPRFFWGAFEDEDEDEKAKAAASFSDAL